MSVRSAAFGCHGVKIGVGTDKRARRLRVSVLWPPDAHTLIVELKLARKMPLAKLYEVYDCLLAAYLSVPTAKFQDMENQLETEGMSPLIESAIRLNEVYKSLMTGGFTEDEALSLIAKMTKNGN